MKESEYTNDLPEDLQIVFYNDRLHGIVLWLKMPSEDLKLFTAIIVAIFLAVPYLKGQSKSSFKKAGKKAAAMAAGSKEGK